VAVDASDVMQLLSSDNPSCPKLVRNTENITVSSSCPVSIITRNFFYVLRLQKKRPAAINAVIPAAGPEAQESLQALRHKLRIF
jgi:hypothetical protein